MAFNWPFRWMRHLGLVVAALLVWLPLTQVAPSQVLSGPVKRPNIVFILTDDLSMDLVQYMPQVRKMQQEGVTFTNYFVTDSLCCPSRASIFTGRFPHNTGVFKNTGADGGYRVFEARGNQQATFATALQAAGYRTAMLGKYLNGYAPRENQADPGWTFWAVAGAAYKEFNYVLNEDRKIVRYGSEPKDYLTDVISGLAVDFIRRSAGTPFAIEIATFAPHAPYIPAPRHANQFQDLKAPRGPAFDAPPDPSAPKWLKAIPPLAQNTIALIDKYYRMRAQSVLAVDEMIGALRAAVAAIGEQNNTYFVFSSDNGYHMGEHRLRPGKQTAFDTDIHVPLVITGPGVQAGRTVDQIAMNVDLAPTFVELGGATALPDVDGRSLVPLLRGQAPADWRTAALIEHKGPHADPSDPDMNDLYEHKGLSGNPTTYEAIRTQTAVYVEYADGEREYYNHVTDANELHNTFASLPESVKRSLHQTASAMKGCRGKMACATAAHR
ncbi:MAG TPA: sulfatase [bacterium]|nr:sulfatase [bacterium]